MGHHVELMAISPDDKWLGIGSECNTGLVSLDEFRLVRSLGVWFPKAMRFSPTGALLAVRTVGNDIHIFQTESGKEVRHVALPRGWTPEPVAFISEEVLWFRHANTVNFLSIGAGTRQFGLRETYVCTAALFLSESNRLVVGTDQGEIIVYKVGSN